MKAMNEEMEALEKNSTWELVSLPKRKRPVGCKWVYTAKLKVDGCIDRYKARLVAKVYTQKYGVYYQETSAPVAKLNTVSILISVVVNKNWSLRKFEVNNAFFNGGLEEEVYMRIPPGVKYKYVHDCKVCKVEEIVVWA